MPGGHLLCRGTIASSPGGPETIEANRKTATWTEPTDGSPGEVRLEWTIGSSECDINAYSGLPPFFFEGDPEVVEELDHAGF
jgi:hypothetical protein